MHWKLASRTAIPFIAAVALCSAGPALGQDEPGDDAASTSGTDESDKTGTNPINFQRDLRVYHEHSFLNTAGDGDQDVTTLEFRTPFAGGKWQFRIRARQVAADIDINGDGNDDVNDQGLGDTDIRFLTVPYLKGKNAGAVALEVFFDTASKTSLGSGSTSLGPQGFYVRFFRGGIGPYSGGGLFAPGLQYKFSVDEDKGRDDTDQILIDLNLLVLGSDKSYWFFTDPQIVFDRETDQEFAIIDVEFGWMMQKWFPTLKGHSAYIRPTFSVGADRPAAYGVEVGYKVIGW